MSLKFRIQKLETKESINKIDIVSYDVTIIENINEAIKKPYSFKVIGDELKK